MAVEGLEPVISVGFPQIEHGAGVKDRLVGRTMFQAVLLLGQAVGICECFEKRDLGFSIDVDCFIDDLPGVFVAIDEFQLIDADVAHKNGEAGGKGTVFVAEGEEVPAHFIEVDMRGVSGILFDGIIGAGIESVGFDSSVPHVSAPESAGQSISGNGGDWSLAVYLTGEAWGLPRECFVGIPSSVEFSNEAGHRPGIEVVRDGQENDLISHPGMELHLKSFFFPPVGVEGEFGVIDGFAGCDFGGGR